MNLHPNYLTTLVKKLRKFWKDLGPGMIAGASNDDPSALITFIQAGAGYGLQLLALPFLTFPFLASLLEMCGRIALFLQKG